MEIKGQEYPELDKVNAARDDYIVIYHFIDWLAAEKNINLCEFNEDREDFLPVRKSLEHFFWEYCDIDPDQVEKERRTLLESINN